MKTPSLSTLFLIVLIGSFSAARSQNVIERVNQRTDRVSLFEVQHGPDGNWIISGQANPGTNIPAPLYFVQSVYATGDTIWDFGHGLMPTTYATAAPADRDKIIVLPDGSVILAGMQDGCDVLTGISSLIKLTPSGAVEWSYQFGGTNVYHPEVAYDRMATNATTKIAVASSDTIRFYQTDGAFSDKWEVQDAPIRCMRWETDTTLLVAASSKLIRFGTNGELLDSVSLPNSSFGIDLHTSENKIWVMTQNSIHVLNEQFQPVANIDLSISTGSALDFEEVDGATWVSNKNGLWSISPQYELENELMFNNEVSASAVNDGIVMTVSTVEQNNRTTGLMKSYRMGGTSIEHTDDVELLVHLDSVVTVTDFDQVPIFTHWAYLTPRIVNHSQDVLQKVMISYSEQYLPAFCGTGGVSLIAENIELAISDTLELNFPPFQVGYYGPFTGDSTITYSACIVAESPNDHLDIFPSDNIWCQDLDFVLPLGIETQSVASLQQSVYPNPTTGIVNLPQIDNLKWELFEVTGRLVSSGSGNITINLSQLGLAEQTYALKLTTNQIQTVVKLVYLQQ